MIYCKKNELKRYFGLSEHMDTAIRFLLENNLNALQTGRNEINDTVYANRFDYETRPEEGQLFETHIRYTDIHMVLSGRELIMASDEASLHETSGDENADYIASDGDWQCRFRLSTDDVLIVFPGEAHKVKCADGAPCFVKKLVVKVPES